MCYYNLNKSTLPSSSSFASLRHCVFALTSERAQFTLRSEYVVV